MRQLLSKPIPITSHASSSLSGWAGDLIAAPVPQSGIAPVNSAPVSGWRRSAPAVLQPTAKSKSDKYCLTSTPPSAQHLPQASSSAQGHREALVQVATSCLSSAWESSTIATYESSLRVHVQGTERLVEASLLPLDSTDKLMLLFASVDGSPWGSIQIMKSAVRAWHNTRNLFNVFDECWDARALQFWRGLKKRADHSHSCRRKRGVSEDEVWCFISARLQSNTPAGLSRCCHGGLLFLWPAQGVRSPQSLQGSLYNPFGLYWRPNCKAKE
jgi:hypothetical protein